MSKQKTMNHETFEVFHRANPDIYKIFKEIALRRLNYGNNVSSAAILQAVRWDYGKKFPNATSPYYARRFVREYPEYIDRFKFSKIKG